MEFLDSSLILEEEIDPNYEPDDNDILEYAQWLGMRLPEDKKYLYIAKEGLKAPLPDPWKPCKAGEDEIYYFNFETGESVWEHPCDQYYKQLFQEQKAADMRRETVKQRDIVRKPESTLDILNNFGRQDNRSQPKASNMPLLQKQDPILEVKRIEDENKKKLILYRREMQMDLDQFNNQLQSKLGEEIARLLQSNNNEEAQKKQIDQEWYKEKAVIDRELKQQREVVIKEMKEKTQLEISQKQEEFDAELQKVKNRKKIIDNSKADELQAEALKLKQRLQELQDLQEENAQKYQEEIRNLEKELEIQKQEARDNFQINENLDFEERKKQLKQQYDLKLQKEKQSKKAKFDQKREDLDIGATEDNSLKDTILKVQQKKLQHKQQEIDFLINKKKEEMKQRITQQTNMSKEQIYQRFEEKQRQNQPSAALSALDNQISTVKLEIYEKEIAVELLNSNIQALQNSVNALKHQQNSQIAASSQEMELKNILNRRKIELEAIKKYGNMTQIENIIQQFQRLTQNSLSQRPSIIINEIDNLKATLQSEISQNDIQGFQHRKWATDSLESVVFHNDTLFDNEENLLEQWRLGKNDSDNFSNNLSSIHEDNTESFITKTNQDTKWKEMQDMFQKYAVGLNNIHNEISAILEDKSSLMLS